MYQTICRFFILMFGIYLNWPWVNLQFCELSNPYIAYLLIIYLFLLSRKVVNLILQHWLLYTRRFGVWPVAMLAQSKNKAVLEGPVCNGSQVIGWHTNEKSKRLRRFHVDMSGFAFNSTILWDPRRWHRPSVNAVRQLDTVKEGFQV